MQFAEVLIFIVQPLKGIRDVNFSEVHNVAVLPYILQAWKKYGLDQK